MPCVTAGHSQETWSRYRESAGWAISEYSSQQIRISCGGHRSRCGKRETCQKMGAAEYIDSKATNAAPELKKMGGARVILATAPSSKAMSELVDGLGPNGTLVVVGAAMDPIEVTPIQLIMGRRGIQGWASGIPTDSEDTLRFAELTGVRPMIEKYPLAKAAEGYARMMGGKAEFRAVLTM